MTVLIEFCLASEVGDLREESTARADLIQVRAGGAHAADNGHPEG